MAYGDYNGPDKADKGEENGSCNRTRCQAPNAMWFNHSSRAWYCCDCRRDIETANARDWDRNFRPTMKRPMFETRLMMKARVASQNE